MDVAEMIFFMLTKTNKSIYFLVEETKTNEYKLSQW